MLGPPTVRRSGLPGHHDRSVATTVGTHPVLSDQPAFAAYRLALSHSSDQKKSIEERGHFVLSAIAQWAPDITRRDPKRMFSSEERAAIYYRDGGVCQEAGCGVTVKFTEFHADHVIPWIHGGVTKLALRN